MASAALAVTRFAQARWTAPITNRLLLEAGYSYQRGDFRVNYQPENPIDAVSKWDLARGRIEENIYFVYDNQERKQEGKIAVSYVTGSHSIKAGFENRWANAIQANDYNGDVATLFTSNNAPLLAAVTNGPSLNKMQFNWDGRVPPGSVAAGQFHDQPGRPLRQVQRVHSGAVCPRLEFREGLLDSLLGIPLQHAVRITGRDDNRDPRRRGSGSQRKLQPVVGTQPDLRDEDQRRMGRKQVLRVGIIVGC